MLVLARKSQQSVVIAANNASDELVRVTVVEVCGGRVKLGFQADNDLTIHREEVWERVCGERETAKPNEPNGKPKYGAVHRLSDKDCALYDRRSMNGPMVALRMFLNN